VQDPKDSPAEFVRQAFGGDVGDQFDRLDQLLSEPARAARRGKQPLAQLASQLHGKHADVIVIDETMSVDDIRGVVPPLVGVVNDACCESSHVPTDLACPTYETGANGRCVYCDHDSACHPGPNTAGPLGHEEPDRAVAVIRKGQRIFVGDPDGDGVWVQCRNATIARRATELMQDRLRAGYDGDAMELVSEVGVIAQRESDEHQAELQLREAERGRKRRKAERRKAKGRS